MRKVNRLEKKLQLDMLCQLYRIAYPNVREYRTQVRKKRKVVTHVEKKEVIDTLRAREFVQEDNVAMERLIGRVMAVDTQPDPSETRPDRALRLK